ncbi:hypothetical protein JCGZ_07106 [Jatropha curcas]|uniref:GH18 domain-containing protein n=1 Tax=Jatropha curcas TaxID=180498 RepID=A0A067KML5_JATCU|nr:hypothetical protein JCGZ_07106 [Jatropha curcas]
MASPKIIILSPLIFLFLYIAIANSESISLSPSPSVSYSPSRATPSYSPRIRIAPAPPTSPTYPGMPASPTYPATPASPAYPIAPPAWSPAPAPSAIPTSPTYPGMPASPTYPATPASPSDPIAQSAWSPAPSATPTSPTYPGMPASPTYPATPASPADPIAPPAWSPPSYPPSATPTSPSYPATPTYPAKPPTPSANTPPGPAQPPFSVVYYGQGIKAAYWPSFNGLVPSNIDTSYFTHIYYAFLLLDSSTFKVNITPLDQQTIPDFINTLRAKNPNIKTLFSIGGADENQTKYFSIMSSNNQTRAVFINSTIEVARNYGFDGLDLDWESPANNQEMVNLAFLLQEWREAIDYEARTSGKLPLLLSAAVYYASEFTNYGENRSYPVQAINNFLDWINPMCYDYHGSWENFTGPNSALYDNNSILSTSYGIGSWIGSGVLREKIVMGVPLYGRTWKLRDPNVNGVGAVAVGVGPGDGVLGYSEIIDFNNENEGVVHFDGEAVFYYSVAGDSWIGYDDTMSVDRKIRFARSQGLGGYFFWALGQDKNWTLPKQALKAWDHYSIW